MKNQFLKFIIVGIFSTFINYGLFYFLLNFFKINYLISSSLGFMAGVFGGFYLNKNWTYNDKNNQSKTLLWKYFSLYITSLLISLIFLKITVDYIGLNAEIANLLSIAITTCVNFIGTKFVVFKK
jgi:putative flippase GtrA